MRVTEVTKMIEEEIDYAKHMIDSERIKIICLERLLKEVTEVEGKQTTKKEEKKNVIL